MNPHQLDLLRDAVIALETAEADWRAAVKRGVTDEQHRQLGRAIDAARGTLCGVAVAIVECAEKPHWSTNPRNIADLVMWLDDNRMLAPSGEKHIVEILLSPRKWDPEYKQMREGRQGTIPCPPDTGPIADPEASYRVGDP